MPGTIHYGDATVRITEDDVLIAYRALIRRIVKSGETEWLPVQGNVDGVSTTIDLLITPGVPVVVRMDGDDDEAADHVKGLLTTYTGDDDSDQSEPPTAE